MANLLTRAMSWPALAFTFCTWAVFLAGIACLQHNCYDGTTGQGTSQVPTSSVPDNLNTYGTSGIFGWSGSVLPCTRLFRFYWFMVAFLFVTIIGAFIAAGPKYGLQSSRPFWIGMFAINTLLFMIASEAALAALDANPFSGGQGLSCMRTTAAGAIMTVVGTIFLLLTIGTDWEGRGRHGGKQASHTYAPREGEGLPTANPAGAGPVTYTGTTA